MERKYQNGFVVMNTNGTKKIASRTFYKIVIRRKEKPNKNDNEPKYCCDVYWNENDDYSWVWIIGESIIDNYVVVE